MRVCQWIFLIVLSLGGFSCTNATSSGAPEEKVEASKEDVEVKVDELENKGFQKQLISNGKMYPANRAVLHFQIGGQIARMDVSNGHKIKKGDVVAVLDQSVLKLRHEQALQNVAKARVEMQDALLSNGISDIKDTIKLSKEKLENIKNRSGYSQAVLSLKQSQQELDQSVMLAPFDGVLANLEKQQYDRVTASDEFCTLQDDRNFKIEFNLLEMELSSARVGQKLKVSPFSMPDVVLDAVISEVNPVVDEHGLVKVCAAVNLPDHVRLFEGQNARVSLQQNIPNQFVVPKEAVVLRSNQEVVFMYENGLAKWYYINILYENEFSYAIKGRDEQLKTGMQVIVSNNMNLAHDARVQMIEHR
ncbi:MAG: efflux RND transporter periplasmic adaptor subunit [Bacteroidales bacterium]|nr:efflux RND transporter periplasmic adaptor subunit [Bacteroidales bacterium]